MSGRNDTVGVGNDMHAVGPAEIGLVLYPGVQMAAVLGMTDLLVFADRVAAKTDSGYSSHLLRISHWRSDVPGKPPSRTFDTAPGGDDLPVVLILPPTLGELVSTEAAAPYVDWLRERHQNGVTLGSICAGAFVLGETGLLDGRTITTHWGHDEAFALRFPRAKLNVDRLIIDDGDIITAGGLMAWIDVALVLIDRFLGPSVMLEAARTFMVDPPGREQSYYSAFSPRLAHGDAAVLKLQQWLQATGAKQTDLVVLAERAGLEERTLLRRFRKATGFTTTEYVQRLRVGRARELLQSGNLPIDAIAWDVGYGDPGALRKVFTSIVGLTPGEYRRRFRSAPRAQGDAGLPSRR